MKVLFLTTWYPNKINPNHGIFIQDQAVVVSREHEVCVVAARIDYKSFGISNVTRTTTKHHNVEENRLVIKRSLPVFNQLNFFIRAFWETYKITKQFQPDVIHGNIGYPGGFWSWLVSKATGKPYVITEYTKITNNFKSPIHKRLTLFALKRTSAIISVSHNHARELNKYTGRNIVVIPNVIKFAKFEKLTTLPPSNPVQIGFLGGMNTPVKGLDILLNALANVKHDFVLHIGGKGTLLEEYKALATKLGLQDKCIFYGFVLPNDIPQFMSKIHFLVSASRFETFGVSMVEALASGLPVLATDSGGPQDFIEPSNGIIVEKESVSALESGLNQMITGYQSFDSAKIRKAITFKFSTENFLRQITTVYQNATKLK